MATEHTNTYDSAYPAITDVTSRLHDNIAVLYGHSDLDRYNALVFQVTRAVRREERVQDAFSIADNGTQSFGWFGESGFSQNVSSPGDEVWSIQDQRASTLNEYGFAVPQDGVWVGIETGDGGVVDGLREGDDRGRGLSASDLNQRAGVLSDLTYVENPSTSLDTVVPTTALSETRRQGLIRIDSEQDGANRFYFGFQNQSGTSVTIDVIGVGLTYDVRIIRDEQTARDIIAGDGYNRRLIQYGAMPNNNPNLPRDWYDHRVTIGERELTPGNA